MKKIPGLLIFAIAVFAFSACQKEVGIDTGTGLINTDTVPDAGIFKVKKYTETVTSTVPPATMYTAFNLVYDANNRVISITDSADASNKFVYTYGTGSYTMDLFNQGSVSIHELFLLNTIPLVDSSFQVNDTQDTTTEKYTYNGNNLVESKEYDHGIPDWALHPDITNATVDASGNTLQETLSSGEVTNYEYYASLNTLYVGLIYLPKTKNLVKKATTTNGSAVSTIDYTYIVDSLNRVITQQEVYSSGETVLKTYTYF